ncbi:MAG: DUF87 domain-containing protein [Planctomycetota bacterium]|nr:DUF87 domain-containing protein [Planctomycetota bacterium]
MQDYEKLGAFYLGREYDLQGGRRRDELLMYDAKDLTTHGVIVGMTGSGKTGLALALLEEAAIDGIPAIAIDPKGDLGNLLLTFPELKPADFAPWIDRDEAARAGQSVEAYAAGMAERWKAGLAEWGQAPERIARFRGAADVALYTPGSRAGLPLTVLRSFDAPPEALRNDAEALRERVTAAASGILALLGLDADPLRSREHILLANLLDHAWRAGRSLDPGKLIHELQAPPFQKVGFVDLETFYPERERFELAMRLNNLLASPGFAGWLDGEALDIRRLLHTPEGKPRLSILSIAHLSDAERMFFVTLLLNEIVAWMRAQPGTGSLRALLYMDEVAGYFPPVANPPSKPPMLALLKQARAYGLGVALATQNPVDLDYKGLANMGTWFLGRLQTERDKARVMEGLEGASVAAGTNFDKARMEATLAGLGNRVFVMNNVHEDEPVVFQTRWALSYLRGPLTREQIQKLTAERGAPRPGADAAFQSAEAGAAASGARPVVPPGIRQGFVPRRGARSAETRLVYRPALLGTARVHFVHAASKVDYWDDVALLATAPGDAPWANASRCEHGPPELEGEPEAGIEFAPLPGALAQEAHYAAWERELKDHLYQTHELTLWSCAELKETSKPGEGEGEFRARLAHQAREQRDLKIEALRKKYAPKLDALRNKLRGAEQKVEREQAQVKQQTFQSAISFGSSLLGALFGRKLASGANVGRAASAARSVGRVSREREDVARAQEDAKALSAQLAEMEAEFARETEALQSAGDVSRLKLEPAALKPRKSDIDAQGVALAWTPWRVDGANNAEPAY